MSQASAPVRPFEDDRTRYVANGTGSSLKELLDALHESRAEDHRDLLLLAGGSTTRTNVKLKAGNGLLSWWAVRRVLSASYAAPPKIELSHDDFLVWRGIEERSFDDFAGAFVEEAVLVVDRITVHDCTLAELNAERVMRA